MVTAKDRLRPRLLTFLKKCLIPRRCKIFVVFEYQLCQEIQSMLNVLYIAVQQGDIISILWAEKLNRCKTQPDSRVLGIILRVKDENSFDIISRLIDIARSPIEHVVKMHDNRFLPKVSLFSIPGFWGENSYLNKAGVHCLVACQVMDISVDLNFRRLICRNKDTRAEMPVERFDNRNHQNFGLKYFIQCNSRRIS